jgi:hypothetical protein
MFSDIVPLLVLDLLPALGDDQFARRQAAQQLIDRLLPAGLVYVEAAAGDDKGDIEIRRRCQQLVASFDRRYFAGRTYPWIDSLDDAFPDRYNLIQDYLGQARLTVPWGSWDNGWPDYRKATELLILDLRAEGVSRSDLDGLLADMARGDEKQKKLK